MVYVCYVATVYSIECVYEMSLKQKHIIDKNDTKNTYLNTKHILSQVIDFNYIEIGNFVKMANR